MAGSMLRKFSPLPSFPRSHLDSLKKEVPPLFLASLSTPTGDAVSNLTWQKSVLLQGPDLLEAGDREVGWGGGGVQRQESGSQQSSFTSGMQTLLGPLFLSVLYPPGSLGGRLHSLDPVTHSGERRQEASLCTQA